MARDSRLLRAILLGTALAVAAAAPAQPVAPATPAPPAPPATPAPPVTPEPYFRAADYGVLKLSPSGRYLGALVPVRGRVDLAVVDLDTNASTVAAGIEGRDIVSFDWVNDNRLVFSIADLQSGLGEQRGGGGLFAVNRDASEFRELAPTVGRQLGSGRFVLRGTWLHSLLYDGSDDVIVVTNDANVDSLDLYRLNTRTGRKTLKSFERPGNVVRWVVDRKGVARAAVTVEKATQTGVWWRADEDAKWVQLAGFGLRGERFLPLAFDGDGTLIVASDIGRATTALHRYDPQTRTMGELLLAHPQADIDDGLVYDRRLKRIVGVRYEAARPGVAWFDDEWARLQATVDASLPGRMNELSRGEAGSRVLVHSYSDTDPGRYYVLDVDKRRLEPLGPQRKDIDPAAMPSREPVRYAARDGLEIPGYLTLPKGRVAKGLPLVLYVHGGPWVHGAHWRWRNEAAFLAAQGYAVLEPAFRGSTGWGRALFEAGWKQWGRAMQDDLVDGIDWLAKQGTIDPKRVCIMGASYGGYAVMMGLARDPERFRCGVNYVGVTDIGLMFDVAWSDLAGSDYLRYAAPQMIGDPHADVEQLKATSPIANAARIRAPVLMAYGGLDFRVPLIHGEKMRDALQAQGTAVEWIVYPDEGHGFLRPANRFDFYRRVAKFLAAHLGPP